MNLMFETFLYRAREVLQIVVIRRTINMFRVNFRRSYMREVLAIIFRCLVIVNIPLCDSENR